MPAHTEARAVEAQVDWSADPYWRNRRLTPQQLLVHDIRLDSWRTDVGAILEIGETFHSNLLPELRNRDRLAENLAIEEYTQFRSEQQMLKKLVDEFGWMNALRSNEVQETIFDDKSLRKCRWIHISSKFTEYLLAAFVSLSDWEKNPKAVLTSVRQLEACIHQNERFSKHGRYFTPFAQYLREDTPEDDNDDDTPMLISIPFLDWTVTGKTPPLRFQIDPREGYTSSKTSSHLLRSILQHFYRLEDTNDREFTQVFTQDKPWTTDRDVDVKVRRWYGHYPSALVVDEVWILVIDSRHVVTFSSNQSWKSRWPPLQLASRIAEVSFRGIRNNFFIQENIKDYTADTHIVAVLNGAVGMLHRSFWSDLVLCLTDRFAGYLGHLQYRLHRSPSTRLVMDLLQVQEELNIIIQIIQQQLDVITDLQTARSQRHPNGPNQSSRQSRVNPYGRPSAMHTLSHPFRATFRQYSTSTLGDPLAQLEENLRREFADFCDLRENANNLLNRTIQLVNIRLEDHGKAIIVFTIVTVIFLPLSFVSSFFGMNVSDIRDMDRNQSIFWITSMSLTAGVVGLATFLAFYGGDITDMIFTWRERARRKKMKEESRRPHLRSAAPAVKSFQVLDAAIPKKDNGF